jgi:hypothetical protein
LESKGEQLLGNLDTQYKKQFFELMTSYKDEFGLQRFQQLNLFEGDNINTSVESHFIEQGKKKKK